MDTVSDTDWAYLAGFIDGEGCIIANPTNRRTCFKPTINLKQVHHPSLQEVQDIFGVGKLYVKKAKGNRHSQLVWRIFRQGEVEYLLRGCLPYLKLKKRQAALALYIQERHNSWTVQQRLKASLMLAAMKKEGLIGMHSS
jgi:hypothetical protein